MFISFVLIWLCFLWFYYKNASLDGKDLHLFLFCMYATGNYLIRITGLCMKLILKLYNCVVRGSSVMFVKSSLENLNSVFFFCEVSITVIKRRKLQHLFSQSLIFNTITPGEFKSMYFVLPSVWNTRFSITLLHPLQFFSIRDF